MRIVTFATPKYEDEASLMVQSAKESGMEAEVIRYEDQGSWTLNCNRKSQNTRELLANAYYNEVVMVVDADGRFQRPLDPIPEMDTKDMALWFIPNVFKGGLSRKLPWDPKHGSDAIGTQCVIWKKTYFTMEFIARWVDRCAEASGVWDQQNLQWVWGKLMDEGVDMDEHVHKLHQGYCKVFDHNWFDKHPPTEYIRHMQASRRIKQPK